MDGALALYTSILSVTSETEDLNGGGLGSSANGAPVLPAGASVTPELDDGDSEDGELRPPTPRLLNTHLNAACVAVLEACTVILKQCSAHKHAITQPHADQQPYIFWPQFCIFALGVSRSQ